MNPMTPVTDKDMQALSCLTRMQTVYSHKDNDPEIAYMLQVFDNEQALFTIGSQMVNGDLKSVEAAFDLKQAKFFWTRDIPATNLVRVLYLPPIYLFFDFQRPCN